MKFGEISPGEETVFVPFDVIEIESSTVRRLTIDGALLYSVEDLLDYFKADAAFYKRWFRWFTQKRDEINFRDLIQVIPIDGKPHRFTTAAGVFRLVQGLKGDRAEKLKSWLAQTAVERVAEELNPSLAAERAVKGWYRKGHTDAWINERLRSLRVRRNFTDEMQAHGAQGQEFAVLTNIVHQGTFGITVQAHYDLKSLSKGKDELREEMSMTELILLSLGEHTSTVLAKSNCEKNTATARVACQKGGEIAGSTRKQIEEALGASVVTSERASEAAQVSLPGSNETKSR